ncbi:MAG: GGDEF domain-containing protein [Mariprofundaceae bacterium]|nr:GGDEF domain-containing protein [Mariprofundaceae bacterium]
MLTYSNSTEPCVLCDSALTLTAQATSYALQLEIKRVLEGLSFVNKFDGYEVSKNSGDQQRSYHMHAYAGQNEVMKDCLTEHILANKALESQEAQFLKQDQSWLCFIPVSYGTEIQNLWLLECAESKSIPSLNQLLLLVSVYQNCASHIGLKHIDPLTGLENRQALSDRLLRKLKGVRRSDDRLPSICMLDIDFFKRVNDDFGHLYGDEVLLLFAGLMKKNFRENDFLYRYGGEEFIVVLHSSSPQECMNALQRFRSAVEVYNFPQIGHITVSIGFVDINMGDLPSSIIDKADKALYYSKQNGRNQVNSYHDLIQKGLIKDEKLKVESEIFHAE